MLRLERAHKRSFVHLHPLLAVLSSDLGRCLVRLMGLTFCCLVFRGRAVLGSAGGILVLLSCPPGVGRCMVRKSSPHVEDRLKEQGRRVP